jgi:8-oxo-dGTP pyrophosphatase MutT (NUDIX family)
MLDDAGSFAGAAAKEIHEETGLDISPDEMLDMTQLAVQSRPDSYTGGETDNDVDEPHLQHAIYPSPGGSDEFIPVFLVRKSLPRQEIQDLKGRLTGLRDHGEKITLTIVPLKDVWKVAARDGKTLAALTLYHGLKSEGRI